MTIPESVCIYTYIQDFENVAFDLTGDTDITNGITLEHMGWYIDVEVRDELNYDRRRTILIEDGFGVNSSRGLNVHSTYGHGCFYWVDCDDDGVPISPIDTSTIDDSSIVFDDWVPVKKDRKTIFKASTKGKGKFLLIMQYFRDGNAYKVDAHGNIAWAENLSDSEFLDRLATRTHIKIHNPNEVTFDNMWGVTRVTETKNGKYYYLCYRARSIFENGQWYLKSYDGAFVGEYNVKPGQVITPADQKTVEDIYDGAPILYETYAPDFGAYYDVDNDSFQEISLNADIPVSNPYDLYKMNLSAKYPTDLYIDNVSIAYNPYSYIYRDGVFIREGYTAEYIDTDSDLDSNASDIP